MTQGSSRYIITDTTISRETQLSADTRNIDERDLLGFLQNMALRAPFNSGLLPPGVRVWRTAGDHVQVVIERQPGLNRINWGARERDPNVEKYIMAQPFQIWIGEFVEGSLIGGRMFYSPTAIYSMNQQLYHQNVPNLNCKGYSLGGPVSVGYVCLYHNQDWSGLSWDERLFKFMERMSGVEAYNDANMYSTDGPRFYQENGKPDYTWNPKKWEKKSMDEGYEWTLDEKLWIPVRVADVDNQWKHEPNGTPLTLEMALTGSVPLHYHDQYRPKPINSLERADLETDLPKIVSTGITVAFSKAKQINQRQEKLTKPKIDLTQAGMVDANYQHQCYHCGNHFGGSDVVVAIQGVTCKGCIEAHGYKRCATCKKWSHPGQLFVEDNRTYCLKCSDPHECATCGTAWIKGSPHWTKVDYMQCTSCVSADEAESTASLLACHLCGEGKQPTQLNTYTSKGESIKICGDCASTAAQCKNCGIIAPQANMVNDENGGGWVCTDCATKPAEAVVDQF